MKLLRLGFLSIALLLVANTEARASDPTNWVICGGEYPGFSGFGLCASITATVLPSTVNPGKYTVTFTVYNMSGLGGESYDGSTITALGIDGIDGGEYVAGSLSVTGTCLKNDGTVTENCAAPTTGKGAAWAVVDDETNYAGGFKIDLSTLSTKGVNYGIISQCGVDAGNAPAEVVFVTDCSGVGPNFVTISFDVTKNFDPSTGLVYARAQNGYPDGEGSTSCLETSDKLPCVPVTTVPEPLTLTLFGTGVAALGGIKVLRHRRREDEVA